MMHARQISSPKQPHFAVVMNYITCAVTACFNTEQVRPDEGALMTHSV